MSDAAPPALPERSDEPPEFLIAAAEEALAENFARWKMNIAPGAIRTLASSAIQAARNAVHTRRLGDKHGT